jgi:thioredoxin 1
MKGNYMSQFTSELTDDKFEKEVLQSKGLSLVDFWAEWCGPCKVLGPTLDSVAQEYGSSVKVFKLDVDANPETPTHFQIRGIPTVLFFKDGKLVDQLVGAQPKETYLKAIEKHKGA